MTGTWTGTEHEIQDSKESYSYMRYVYCLSCLCVFSLEPDFIFSTPCNLPFLCILTFGNVHNYRKIEGAKSEWQENYTLALHVTPLLLYKRASGVRIRIYTLIQGLHFIASFDLTTILLFLSFPCILAYKTVLKNESIINLKIFPLLNYTYLIKQVTIVLCFCFSVVKHQHLISLKISILQKW